MGLKETPEAHLMESQPTKKNDHLAPLPVICSEYMR